MCCGEWGRRGRVVDKSGQETGPKVPYRGEILLSTMSIVLSKRYHTPPALLRACFEPPTPLWFFWLSAEWEKGYSGHDRPLRLTVR